MPTDNTTFGKGPVKLADFASSEVLRRELGRLEEKSEGPIFLEARIEDFERIRESLLIFRASNVSPLLVLQPSPLDIAAEELEIFIGYFKLCDQLSLHNILTLMPTWIPEPFRKDLLMEAKMELKWFQEWSAASQDQRIARYPGLPWRSYLRKVIGENFDFAMTLLRVGNPSERDAVTVENLIRAYLKAKKKAICFFPKKWGRLQ